jgi:hypothetical protein
MIEPMYHAVFFDTDIPQTRGNALNKRIKLKEYLNLTDEFPGKEVQLLPHGSEDPSTYIVTSVKTFHIYNTVDNSFFVICEVKRKPTITSIFSDLKIKKT